MTSDRPSPEQVLQRILQNVQVGGNLTVGNITQIQYVGDLHLPHNIPLSDTVRFVGRSEELERLHQMLQHHDQVVISAIQGMGGVGKTELATQYARLHLQLLTYPGGICWLQARDEDIGIQVVRFAQVQLGLKPPEDLDLLSQVDFCWSRWREGDVLLVLDDVNDYPKVQPYLPPQPSRFKVLITTRLQLELPQSLTLDILGEKAALELLQQWVRAEQISQELANAQKLCQHLGYLPLGLQLVGQYVKKRKLSLAEMLRRIEKEGLRHPSLVRDANGRSWTNINRGVAAAFELSWEELNEDAKQLGCLLSLFALAPIPWSLVESIDIEQNLKDLEDARAELESLYLFQGEPIYRLHPLVREFFREKLEHSKQADDLKRAFAVAMVEIAKQIPDPYSITREVIFALSPVIPHIAEVAEYLTTHLDKEDLFWAFDSLGTFFEGQGFYEQAEPWFEKSLAIAQTRFGYEHPNVANSFNNLALLYVSQGRYSEAEPLHLRAIELRQSLLGEGHPDVASSLNNLALLYASQGRYSEAEPLLTKALEINKRLLGEGHSNTLSNVTNLAYLYSKQNRYDEADRLYLQALELRQQLLGEEHSDVASSLNNLALLYASQGRYSEAEPLLTKALKINKRLLGDEHPHVASILNNLAYVYEFQCRYREAQSLYSQALAICQQRLGANHPYTIDCQEALASLLQQTNSNSDNDNEKTPPGVKLRYTLQGHENVISRVVWSPQGEILASLSYDNTIRLWSFPTGKLKLLIEIPTRAISLAWSPDGQMLASGSDNGTIYVWNAETGQLCFVLEHQLSLIISLAWSLSGETIVSGDDSGKILFWDFKTQRIKFISHEHYGEVYSLVLSPNGKVLASRADDFSINLWDTESKTLLNKLHGHSSPVLSVAWSPSKSIIASGSLDKTIYIWDLETNRPINIIEGHTSTITSVSFSYNGDILASRSHDGTVRIWSCSNWQTLAVLEEASDESSLYLTSLAFHPKAPILSTLAEEDKSIRIWSLEIDNILKSHKQRPKSQLPTKQLTTREILGWLWNTARQSSAQYDDTIHYINAKIVLVGESGVGKSGLGVRVAEKEFRRTESTHGAQFWQISVTEKVVSILNLTKVHAELTLWDLAGQPDYYLVHQLFLDNTDVALLLFDCSDAANPFRGVPYWAKVLKKQAPPEAVKYLVSSRCDVSPVTVERREINKFLAEYGLDDYFRTSAKTGEGTEKLLEAVLNNISWNTLRHTTTLRLFQVREFLLERKEVGDILIPLEQVKKEIEQCYTESPPTQAEIDTVVELLQVRGFVYRLAPTPNLPLVLLRPELINKYASSIIQAARNHPEGIGAIPEREVVCANLPFNGFEPGERLPPSEEKLVLESTVELFIRHTLAFREMGRLVFPSQLNILHRIPVDEHPPTEVTFEFSGSVEAIYASLVVCLSYTQDFQRENLWKYAVEFSREGHQLGFAMQQVAEGTGELEIYFYPGVSDFDRVTFIRFIKNHLYTKGIDLQERIRLYCPECSEEVKNRKAIERRVQAGKLEIPCQYCDTAVLIPRSIEEKYRSDRAYLEKQKELQATVEKRTQQEVKAFRQNHQQYMADSDNCIRILHLSDIHLGTVEQANRYFSQLATDLTQNLNIKQLNYLVISGDIANCSTEDEYDAAFYLVDKLVKRYGLDPSRVVIVPGNHDLNWDLAEAAYPFVAKRKLPNPLPEGRYIEAGGAGALICDEAEYKQRFTYFSDRFYKKVYGKPYPLEYDQQAILHPCPQDKILFLALNSCWEIDHHYRDRAGIHSNAIANAVDQILSENYDDWLKIAVWHHPVNGSESMQNPAFLEQLAVTGFQLGIHGHIHEARDENFQYDTKRGLRIIAAGTFGAPTHEQVTGIPLQYNLLALDPETGELTVETRKKEKADGAWSADARWGDKNNPIPEWHLVKRDRQPSSQPS